MGILAALLNPRATIAAVAVPGGDIAVGPVQRHNDIDVECILSGPGVAQPHKARILEVADGWALVGVPGRYTDTGQPWYGWVRHKI